MIIKSVVDHNVGLARFSKYWLKRIYNAIPSAFVKPIDTDIQFVFIVGCGHSGTTLMAAKLSNHSSIMGIGRETNVMAPGNYSLFGARAIAQEWAYFSEFNDNSYVLEKTPKHVYAYDSIKKVIPKSKFVVMTRNPLDTIASLYKRFGNLDFCIERWLFDNAEALAIIEKKDTILVKYEEFTREPERGLRDILEFLGLDYEPEILKNSASIYNRTMQKGNMQLRREQVDKPIKPNMGGWKKILSEEQAKQVIDRVSELARRFDYNFD